MKKLFVILLMLYLILSACSPVYAQSRYKIETPKYKITLMDGSIHKTNDFDIFTSSKYILFTVTETGHLFRVSNFIIEELK